MLTVQDLRKRENCRNLAEPGIDSSCQCNKTGEVLKVVTAPVVSQRQNELLALARGVFKLFVGLLGVLLTEPKLVREVGPHSRPLERHEFERIQNPYR